MRTRFPLNPPTIILFSGRMVKVYNPCTVKPDTGIYFSMDYFDKEVISIIEIFWSQLIVSTNFGEIS